VKVLDFGLAKMVEAPPSGGVNVALTNSPTITTPAMMTSVGTILGTAAYMSPEQAKGKPADKRTDIWAFGCVLFEMLAGRRAFGGTTVPEALAAVLEREVDWTKLPSTTPASVRAVLRRALEKDPRRRLHDIADARIELDDTAPHESAKAADAGGVTQLRWLALLVGTTVAVGLGAGATAWYFKAEPRQAASSPAAVTRLVLVPEASLSAEREGVLALSHDGRRLAYVATAGNHRALHLRDLDRFEAVEIPGTDGAGMPAFSPDGKWIAFEADGQIKKVAVVGGMAVPLCDCGEGRGLSWESNDAILFARQASGIWRVPGSGGKPSAVTTLRPGELQHEFPEILPGGKALLYSSPQNGIASPTIFAESLENHERREVGRGAGARYVHSGYLVYAQTGTLLAVPFDAARLEPRGDPTVVLQGIQQAQFGEPQIAYSTVGSMTYLPAGGGNQNILVWLDDAGREEPTGILGPDLLMPRVAPDLQRVAVLSQGDVWLYDLARNARSRFTFDGRSSYLVWAPTGSRLAYRSERTGRPETYVKTVDGGAPEERLATDQGANVPLSWSPDGRFLAAVAVSPKTGNDIWVHALGTSTPAMPFAETPFREGAPTFSPDGRWIAFASDQSGRAEIYMRPFPGPGEEWTISTAGGNEPVWARKAGRLFYRQGDAMMAVDITTAPAVVVGKPRRLFDRPYYRSSSFWPNYDVTPDGRRLLMIKGGAPGDSRRINVVLNWFEELKQRVPVK
jgi:serine/threonine-protein kinase